MSLFCGATPEHSGRFSYLSHHAPFSSSSLAPIGAVGTITLGLFYILPLPHMLLARRFTHLLRRALWASLAINVAAMFTLSFATNVAELIFLQGIVCASPARYSTCPP
jgi:hypothetical protein